MAKKINKSLLNEELKRFRLLSEYTFYTEDKNDDLILGNSLEEAEGDEETADAPATDAPATDAPATDAPVDDSKTAANQEVAGDDENMFSTDTEDTGEQPADTGTEEEPVDTGDETTDVAAEEEPTDTGDEVEVDVTKLVQGSEEAKEAATSANQKTDELLARFNDLESRISKMDAITSKIDDLEKEIVKRNPTPVEKLEMRSLNSFPYNIKLTDYFKDIEGYDVGTEQQPKEYVLTQDDVNNDFLDQSIKNSFDVPEDYEEEEI